MLPTYPSCIAATLASLALLASGPVVAQARSPTVAPIPGVTEPSIPAVTPEGAAAIESAITETLATWFPAGDPTATWAGDAVVTVEGNVYAVRLPALTAALGTEAIALDSIALKLLPLADGSYQVDMTLPASLQRLAPDRTPLGTVEIGGQRFAGLWNPAIGTLTSVDAGYAEIAVTTVQGDTTITTATLSELGITSDYQEVAGGKWSGVTQVTAKEFSMLEPDGTPTAGLAALDFDLELSEASFAALLGVRDGVMAANPADRGQATLEQIETVDSWLNGVSASVGVEGLFFPIDEATAVDLKDGSLTLSLDGLAGDASSFALGMSFKGASTQPPLGAFNPEAMTLEIAAVDLPNARLANAAGLLRRMLPGNPQAAAMIFAQQVAMALGQASSQIKVDELSLNTPTAGGLLAGAARFTPRSVLGLTADFNLNLRGVEEAMAALEPAPGQSLGDETQTALAVLGMLQALGQMGNDEAGRPVRTYRIRVTADGRATLNGADLSALFGGMARR